MPELGLGTERPDPSTARDMDAETTTAAELLPPTPRIESGIALSLARKFEQRSRPPRGSKSCPLHAPSSVLVDDVDDPDHGSTETKTRHRPPSGHERIEIDERV